MTKKLKAGNVCAAGKEITLAIANVLIQSRARIPRLRVRLFQVFCVLHFTAAKKLLLLLYQ